MRKRERQRREDMNIKETMRQHKMGEINEGRDATAGQQNENELMQQGKESLTSEDVSKYLMIERIIKY